MKKFHIIERLLVDGDQLLIDIDGHQHSFDLRDISPKLASASITERQKFELSPSGYGIHWSLIDEDISIDGLLGIHHAPAFLHDKIAV